MNPLNKKELAITYSMKEQAEIRLALAERDIDYSVKLVNRCSPGALGRAGAAGQNMESLDEYIIYVHKQDYERAKEAIRRHG